MGSDIASTLLNEGGRVYDHDGNPHQPPTADILIEDSLIAHVGPNLAGSLDQAPNRTIDARGKLAWTPSAN